MYKAAVGACVRLAWKVEEVESNRRSYDGVIRESCVLLGLLHSRRRPRIPGEVFPLAAFDWKYRF